MEIGEYIKALRMQKGLTLEQVGNAVGVGKSTVRKWEVGSIKNMGRDKIVKLAAVLGVSPSDLLGFSPEAQIENIRAEIEELQQALQTEPEGENREDLAEALDAKTEELEDLEFMYHIRAMTRPKSAPAASLTEDEARLIEWWRTLPEEKQKAILNLSKVF